MKKIFTLFAFSIFSVCGNAQWDTLTSSTNTNFNSIFFSNNQEGVAVGKNPVTNRGAGSFTLDGGLTWQPSNLAANVPSINDVSFFSSTLGYAVADSGLVMYCGSIGYVFASPVKISSQNLNCIFSTSDSVLFIGGDYGTLYHSSDYGLNWDTLNSGTNIAINDIYFKDPLNGWIVGDGGYMATSADGGQTWNTVGQPYFGFFNCMGMAYAGSTANVFAVGNSGDMIHSLDGGLNWGAFSSNTSYNLNSVRFTNDLAGIVVGDHGIIYRTQDGGMSWWDESLTYVTENLTSVSWASDTLAYICGKNGRVLKSHSDISAVHTVLPANFEISAFPNPFTDELNVMINLDKTSNVQVSVMDLTGRILFVENEGEMNVGKQVIHLTGISTLESAMYFVKVISGNGEMVIPVLKQ